MANLANWGNQPSPDWIEPWRWASQVMREIDIDPAQTDTPTNKYTPRFDLMAHWEHGGYPASLFAASPLQRNEYLTRHIANNMPPIPASSQNGVPIEQVTFWRLLARYNGCQLDTLFRRLHWDSQSFEVVIDSLIAQGLIFTIGYMPLRSDSRSELYYFRDTGLLHQLLNPKWSKTGHGRKYFDKSWEGFVIQVLCNGVGLDAEASVWRKGIDEIDLLLDWRGADQRWGVEISRSDDKRPQKGYWAASRELRLTDAFIIHMGDCTPIDHCRRYTLERFLAEVGGEI